MRKQCSACRTTGACMRPPPGTTLGLGTDRKELNVQRQLALGIFVLGFRSGRHERKGRGSHAALWVNRRDPLYLKHHRQVRVRGLHASLGNINLVLTSSAVMSMSFHSISVVCGKAACVRNYTTGASDQAADKASY